MKHLLLALAATFTGAMLTSCKKKERDPLNLPDSYTSSDYELNTAEESAIRNQLAELSSYMKRAENAANRLNADSLNNRFSSGTASLSSLTPLYFRQLITNSWFPVLVNCSGNNYDPAWGDTATNGGVYGARLFDKRGKETLQEIEKGLFAAALLNRIITLGQGTVTKATVDRMISLYGAHATFPNTNTASKTSYPDVFIALYVARRDKNDGAGMYTDIKKQFIKLKAAIEAGSEYDKEKQEALNTLPLLMERGIMATVVNYGYGALTKLSTTNPPATTVAGGLHDLGEMVGFIHGFKTVPQASRKITDEQIDELLTLLLSPAGAESNMYQFVTDGINQLPKITQLQLKLKQIYGFSAAVMEDFKQNWISVQGR